TEFVDWTNGGTTYQEDIEAVAEAIAAGQRETHRPTLIRLRTIIGWPAPTKQNTGAAHGAALGEDEVRGIKEYLGFQPDESFVVADDVLAHTRSVVQRGADTRQVWQRAFSAWSTASPQGADLLHRLRERRLPEGWSDALPAFEEDKDVSTRKASGAVLSALGDVLPELWGGSADLAG